MGETKQLVLLSIPEISSSQAQEIASALRALLPYTIAIINAPLKSISLEDLRDFVQGLDSKVKLDE